MRRNHHTDHSHTYIKETYVPKVSWKRKFVRINDKKRPNVRKLIWESVIWQKRRTFRGAVSTNIPFLLIHHKPPKQKRHDFTHYSGLKEGFGQRNSDGTWNSCTKRSAWEFERQTSPRSELFGCQLGTPERWDSPRKLLYVTNDGCHVNRVFHVSEGGSLKGNETNVYSRVLLANRRHVCNRKWIFQPSDVWNWRFLDGCSVIWRRKVIWEELPPVCVSSVKFKWTFPGRRNKVCHFLTIYKQSSWRIAARCWERAQTI